MLNMASAVPAASQPLVTDSARALIEQGVKEAQQNALNAAITSFKQAADVGGYTPIIIFNLGLAESKIPGHELRAMAWLEAYLAETPNAENSEKVRELNRDIRQNYEAKLRSILEKMELLWHKHWATPNADFTTEYGGPQSDLKRFGVTLFETHKNLLKIAAWRLAASRFFLGDIDRAESILRESTGDNWREAVAQEESAIPNTTEAGEADWWGPRYSDSVVDSMISTGLYDEAIKLTPYIYDADTVYFSLERFDIGRANALSQKPSGVAGAYLLSCLYYENNDQNDARAPSLRYLEAEKFRLYLVKNNTTWGGQYNITDKQMAENLRSASLDAIIGRLMYIDNMNKDAELGGDIKNLVSEIYRNINDADQKASADVFISGKQVFENCAQDSFNRFASHNIFPVHIQQLVDIGLGGEGNTDLVNAVSAKDLGDDRLLKSESSFEDATEWFTEMITAYRKVRGPALQ